MVEVFTGKQVGVDNFYEKKVISVQPSNNTSLLDSNLPVFDVHTSSDN